MNSSAYSVLKQAEFCSTEGRLGEAERLLKDSLEQSSTAEQTKQAHLIKANCLSSLAVVQKKMGKYEDVLSTLKSLLKTIISYELGTIEQAIVMVNIGTALFHLKKADRSISYTQKAFKILHRAGSKSSEPRKDDSLINSSISNPSSDNKQILVNQILAYFNMAVYYNEIGSAIESSRSLNTAKTLAINKFGFKQKITELVTKNIEVNQSEMKPFFLAQKFAVSEILNLHDVIKEGKNTSSSRSEEQRKLASIPLLKINSRRLSFSKKANSDDKQHKKTAYTPISFISEVEDMNLKVMDKDGIAKRISSSSKDSQNSQMLPKLTKLISDDRSNQMLGIRIDKTKPKMRRESEESRLDFQDHHLLLTESDEAQSGKKSSKIDKGVQTSDNSISQIYERENDNLSDGRVLPVIKPQKHQKKSRTLHDQSLTTKPNHNRTAELMELLSKKIVEKPPRPIQRSIPVDYFSKEASIREKKQKEGSLPPRSFIKSTSEKSRDNIADEAPNKTPTQSHQTSSTAVEKEANEKKKINIDRLNITLRYME